MSEWWTYRLSDFLLYAPRTYFRLFELYNDTWRNEETDPTPITEAVFDARLVLSSVDVGEENGLTFWYGDGDLFAGHSIEVSGDLTDGFTSANLAG